MTNKEIAEFVFDRIRSYGFKPRDIEYGNSYFIFDDYGDNSIIHFRIKNVWKHWKFGMWITEDNFNNGERGDVVVEFFCQYDTQIDKFKPSRSNLCVELTKEAIQHELNNEYNYFYTLKDMLLMLKKHPFLSYQIDQVGDRYYSQNFISYFIQEESQAMWEVIKENVFMMYVPYTKFKLWIAKRFNFVKEAKLYNFNKKDQGWISDAKYEIRFLFTKDSTNEKEIKLLDWLFHKDEYGKFKNWRCTIRLDRIEREGIDFPYFYKQGE